MKKLKRAILTGFAIVFYMSIGMPPDRAKILAAFAIDFLLSKSKRHEQNNH